MALPIMIDCDPDIPVAGGAWKPLMRDLIIADNVHGESGLDGPSLPEPAFAPQNCTAVELMASVLRESQEPVTLVATGPQTTWRCCSPAIRSCTRRSPVS